MAVLEELGAAVKSATETVGPAVVGLGRGWGRGSGVVIGVGLVLTNAHNLRGDEITVTFADGRTADGTVAGVDADADVAVVRVDTTGVAPIEFAADAEPDIGTPVFALANPGGRGLRATVGFVSSSGRSFRGPRGRRVRGAIEHTAPLPSGSSGGPLVDTDGRLIGINSVRMDGGLILALPTDASVKTRIDSLAEGNAPQRAQLGIAIAPAHVARKLRRSVGLPDRDGLLVRGVEDAGAADRAGIERGDLIVAANGNPTKELDDIHTALDDASTALALTIVRGAAEREVTVELEAR